MLAGHDTRDLRRAIHVARPRGGAAAPTAPPRERDSGPRNQAPCRPCSAASMRANPKWPGPRRESWRWAWPSRNTRPNTQCLEYAAAAVRQCRGALIEARLCGRIVRHGLDQRHPTIESLQRDGQARADHAAADDGDVERAVHADCTRRSTASGVFSSDAVKTSGCAMGHQHIVFDAHTDVPEFLRVAGRGADIDAGLDGQRHAGLEDSPFSAHLVIADVVDIETQPVSRCGG